MITLHVCKEVRQQASESLTLRIRLEVNQLHLEVKVCIRAHRIVREYGITQIDIEGEGEPGREEGRDGVGAA